MDFWPGESLGFTFSNLLTLQLLDYKRIINQVKVKDNF